MMEWTEENEKTFMRLLKDNDSPNEAIIYLKNHMVGTLEKDPLEVLFDHFSELERSNGEGYF